jgi:hypothetical protein
VILVAISNVLEYHVNTWIGTSIGTLAISRFWLIGFSNKILSWILSTGTPISRMTNFMVFVPDTKLILILMLHLVSAQKMKLLLLFLLRLFLLIVPLLLQQMQFLSTPRSIMTSMLRSLFRSNGKASLRTTTVLASYKLETVLLYTLVPIFT